MDSSKGPPTDLTNGSCDQSTFLLCMLGTSVGIIICLSLLEKRTNACCRCITRLGMIYPVNLLDHGCDTFGYSMAFGCVASACFNLFFYSIGTDVPAWSKTLYLMFRVLVYGLMFYPLFACLTTTRVFLGSLLGFGYTTLWLYYYIRLTIDSCVYGETPLIIALSAPIILCSFFLLLRYVYIFFMNLRKIIISRSLKEGIKQQEREHLGTRYNIAHVKELLVPGCGDYKGPDVDITNIYWMNNFLAFIRRSVYRNDPIFKYSPRIICVFTVALICAYQFGIITIYGVISLRKLANQLVVQHTPANITGETEEFLAQIQLFIDVCEVSSLVSLITASLFTLYSTFQILTNYRRTMKQMYKGVFHGMPFKRDEKPPNIILSNSLYYSGSQIAYLLWSYIISFLVLLLLCIVVTYFVILPIFGMAKFLGTILINTLTPFLMWQLFRIVQKVSCHVFLQKINTVNTEGKRVSNDVLALNNRKAYHNVSYFLFFFYIVLGFFGCLSTIIKGVVLGVFFLARKDRCSLVSGFETWDTGFLNYVSFLYVEECHRHPVLLVFCDILLDGACKRRSIPLKTMAASDSCDVSITESNSDPVTYGSIEEGRGVISRHKLLSRNRWFKAYTMIRNPGLVEKDIGEDYDRCEDSADIEHITIHEFV